MHIIMGQTNDVLHEENKMLKEKDDKEKDTKEVHQ